MKNPDSFSHLTLEERRIILTGISNGSTKTAIAQTIGKDKSTVGKEIKAHRKLTHKCSLPLECSAYRKCPFKRQCTPDCPEYIPFRCSRRDRSPGACNGCSNWAYCRFDKYQYSPEEAHNDYLSTLVDSRQGVNLTSSEARAMAAIVSPLLKQGQSLIRSSPAIPNWASAKRLFTITSKAVSFSRSLTFPSWTSGGRSPEGSRKRSPRVSRREMTADIYRAGF